METEYSKATEYGNYLSMDNQAFPIDCETLAALQNNTKKLAALGWIAGCNKLILIGCNIAGRERKEGYVFVVSSDNPLTGEVLYYKGGSSSEDKCHISEKTVNVTADGTDFPKAYSIRMLEDGVAGEPMNWADFGNVNEISNLKLFQSIKKEVSDITSVITSAINSEATNRDKAISSAISAEVTNRDKAISNAVSNEATNRDKAISSAISNEVTNRDEAIASAITTAINKEKSDRNTAIAAEINKISAFKRGMILMWSGTVDTIPDGWGLCDGNQHGGVYCPNLTDKFIIGAGKQYSPTDCGGSKTHTMTLTIDQMPYHRHNVSIKRDSGHSHKFDDSYLIDNGDNNHKLISGKRKVTGTYTINKGLETKENPFLYYSEANTLSAGEHTHTVTEEYAGKGSAIYYNVMPPYYALCFIMKL